MIFSKLGYDVVAVDACKELIELATDDDVDYKVSTFEDFLESNTTKFDGIWCCAPLLHVEYSKLSAMLNKLKDQLNKDGVIYASFKHGNAERIDEYGRLFCDMNFERFDRLKVEYKGCWITKDVVRDIGWFNVLI